VASRVIKVRGAGIAEWPKLAARDHVGNGESLAPKHVDVPETERRKTRYVFFQDHMAFRAKLVELGVDVDRVPEHDHIDDQPERAKLVLLAISITLAQFAALAVEYRAGKLMADLATVELDEDATPVGSVVNEPKHVERLDETAEFLKRTCQPGRTIVV
jgi:hypothetical protein